MGKIIKMTNEKNTILAVLGATATGKTDFAIDLALKNNGEIVNCDSRQIYMEMLIGTASPSEEERKIVPHHLFNFLSPDEPFSASDYQIVAVNCIKRIWKKGKIPILVGGTGFYYSAVSDGLGEAGHSPKIAVKLHELLKEKGLDFMVQKLAELDPTCIETIDTNNSRRVLRAIEVVMLTQKPFGENKPVPPFPSAEFKPTILTIEDRSELHARIEKRIGAMFEAGLEKEVRILHENYGRNAPGLASIGYREWFDYFDGKINLKEVKEFIINHTRQYAKRQCTWFSKQPAQREEIKQEAFSLIRC